MGLKGPWGANVTLLRLEKGITRNIKVNINNLNGVPPFTLSCVLALKGQVAYT